MTLLEQIMDYAILLIVWIVAMVTFMLIIQAIHGDPEDY